MKGLVTVKATALLAAPLTVTTTLKAEPPGRPEGTVAVIEVELQLVVEATVVPNFTVLLPLVDPKPVPVMITEVPVAPEVGDRLEISGAAKREPLAIKTKKREATKMSTAR